jgi:acid stress-induced BolA-like protein IbaG/YrbA
MMPIEELRGLLTRAFRDGEVSLTSPTGDNVHFQCLIVSPGFEGKSMVERHQMVYQALGNAMDEAVHALSLKTYTPAQWEKLAGSA